MLQRHRPPVRAYRMLQRYYPSVDIRVSRSSKVSSQPRPCIPQEPYHLTVHRRTYPRIGLHRM
uniref:Uncharacterized protein n=1 Tax=Anguilla anguilla TaxID=7936 RepID=A0A0E9UC61_ANGAN